MKLSRSALTDMVYLPRWRGRLCAALPPPGRRTGFRFATAIANNAWHHYEYMVDGFLSGHLYLSLPPPKELLALPDPYDPTQNIRYRLWDVSLYQGKYYLYYGPTPALLLMLPWKVVTGHHLPQRLATGIFAVAGFAAIALLAGAGVRRRYFSRRFTRAIILGDFSSWVICHGYR